MSAHYWSRQCRFSRSERAVTLHFTRHPDDVVIRVALKNQPAHDVIVAPAELPDRQLFLLVRDYTRALTRPEVRALQTVGIGTPTPPRKDTPS